MTNENQTRLYGVSSGNGNDGVSRMFADYYVRTNDPWRLAELAAISDFKPGNGKAWAKRHIEIDGEAKYGISAVFYDPPCEDTEDGEYPELSEEDSEDAEDGRNFCEANGAWSIYEIFPASEDDTRDRPVYDSLEDCFSEDDLTLCPSE